MPKQVKKINLRLDSKLAESFEQTATRRGVTKSSLLREWIETMPTQVTVNRWKPEAEVKNYCVLLETETYSKLLNAARDRGLTVSALLRILIGTNTVTRLVTSNPTPKLETKPLFVAGKFHTLIESFQNNYEAQPSTELLRASRALYFSGDLLGMQEVIDILAARQIDDVGLVGEVNYLKALYSLGMHRDLKSSFRYLNLAINQAQTARNRRLLAEAYLQKAVVSFYADDLHAAVEFHQRSLDYIDIISAPNLYAHNYLCLATVYTCLLKPELSSEYLRKAEDLLLETKNAYYLAMLYRRQAIDAMTFGHLESVETLLRADRTNTLEAGAHLFVSKNLEEYGKYHLANGDLDKAYGYFCRAIDGEVEINPNFKTNRSQAFKLYIESIENKQSLAELSRLASQPLRMQSQLSKYVYYSAMYVQQDSANKQRGEESLKMLQDTAQGPIMRRAAEVTLKTKQLQPVW